MELSEKIYDAIQVGSTSIGRLRRWFTEAKQLESRIQELEAELVRLKRDGEKETQ